MTVYEFGSPYFVYRRDKIPNPETHEMVHGQKYELVYKFETREPMSLRQANELYSQLMASRDVPRYAKIKYFKVQQSSTKGTATLQFESAHPVPLALIIAGCIAAFAVAATVAAIIFVAAPTLAAAYTLTTGILSLPKPVGMAVSILLAAGVGYVAYRLFIKGRKT